MDDQHRSAEELLQEVQRLRARVDELESSRSKLEYEHELRQSQKMEAIGTLAGGIAHDFNNILSVILGYAQMSFYGADPGSALQSNMKQVVDACKRAKDLVRQVLTFSRQNDQEMRPVAIEPVIKEALKFLRASLPSTIQMRQNIHAGLDPIFGDPTQIHQVLMNLCTNAAHAMKLAGGLLEVRLEHVSISTKEQSSFPELYPGPYIKISVSDTGHGMDRATLDRIFDPYFTTKEKMDGTGLGLSVVHGIVKNHRGTIRVFSQAGSGSTFEVYLPRLQAELEACDEEDRLLCSGTGHILFVDEEEALVNIGKKMLEHLGYTVDATSSPRKGLDLFRRSPHSYDLVLTDKTMPELTGFKLAEQMLALRPDIPIIICTGYGEAEDQQLAHEMGIREVIIKPLILQDLSETLHRVLQTHAERRGQNGLKEQGQELSH